MSILIVDDEPDVAELFRQRFRREVRQSQYAMHLAGCRGNLGQARRRRPARTDRRAIGYKHPGHGRAGLLQEVKRCNAELPVIMVTAYGDHERRRAARERGAADFITKPVDFDNLKRLLQQLAPPRAEAE